MNFKPTLWKSITSVIFGIVANFVIATSRQVLCNCAVGAVCDCPGSTWADSATDPGTIVVSLVVLAMVYYIWSLIQKK